MSKTQKLQEILAKLKSWAESNGDETLDGHLNELENEINASFTAQADAEGDEGSNNPDQPPTLP